MSLLARKYVQIFSLQRNISEMSVKNNFGEAHEKRLLHPPPREEREREIEGNKRTRLLWTGGRDGDGEGEEGGGSQC